MLTLSDINTLTDSKDGDIYSDLFKDVYGSRPRGTTFESIEAFDQDYEYLIGRLNSKMAEEKAEKAIRWSEFLNRLDAIKQLETNCDTARACEILADAEGIDAEERKFYGWESLEWKLGIEFGSIKPYLVCEAQNDAFLEEMRSWLR
jgi:hypothetical protein